MNSSSWLSPISTSKPVNQFALNLILSRFGCGYRRGMDWILHLSTTYTHHVVLQVFTAPPLITGANTKSSPPYSVNSRSLATASNSGDSSASRVQVCLLLPLVQNSTQMSPELQRHLFSASLAELNSQLGQSESVMLRPTVSRHVCL
jgi:hypothetical protein